MHERFTVMQSYVQTREVFEPAADALSQAHGGHASFEAAKQVSALISNGIYSLPASWQQIRVEIVERQQAEGHRLTTK